MSEAPRVAVVHDWLIDFAGSERVLAEILKLYPGADVFTLIDRMAPADRGFLQGRRIHTTFLQRMPGLPKRLAWYLPLMPLAIEQLDVTGYDLVISSSHAVAKGVIVSPDALHMSYVHSPMRYAWDLQFAYLRDAGLERGLRGAALRYALHRLRQWDRASAAGVDAFAANSAFVARRIRKAYRRESVVIPPPVDTAFFTPGAGQRGDGYVTVARLMPYKGIDLLLEAFRRMPGRRLTLVGEGPLKDRLAMAAPRNVTFAGHVPREELRALLQSARAFVFAAIEDFGIAPVEAMACGTPVVALRRGGAAETVSGLASDAPTGVLFAEPTADAVVAAIEALERDAGQRITPAACRRRAESYSADRFAERFTAWYRSCWQAWQAEAGARPPTPDRD